MNCSMMSGASRANRSSLPTVVGISPSACAMSATPLESTGVQERFIVNIIGRNERAIRAALQG